MKNIYAAFLIVLYSSIAANQKPQPQLCFTENKGQIGDQYNLPRTDILFSASDGKLTFHLKKDGLSYQQYRIAKSIEVADPQSPDKNISVATETDIHRVDINWPGANKNATIKYGERLPGYSNFYNPVCPQGVHEAFSYASFTYENIYKGIDLKWYQKNGHIKYDYLVAPGADLKQIKLKYEGAEKISINHRGELLIYTSMGIITEEAPVVFQNEKMIDASWKIQGNTVSFTVGNYNPLEVLIIDPGVRQWGTYYGGNGIEVCSGIVCDTNGDVYFAGYTDSNNGTFIATVGSHQSVYGGGINNAFLAKFKSNGGRVWATYYGGPVREIGASCALDPSGNIFMSGHSMTPNSGAIATAGAHQTTHGGNWDAFVVKFNSLGVRQWGSYYGDNQIDFGYSCTTDNSGNVYLTGKTNVAGGTVIATPGSHQTNYGGFEDAFLVKFSPTGQRLWGTYLGGNGSDVGYGLDTDYQGNIYLVGHTSSTTGIATAGAHQTTQGNAGNGWDGFVTKFSNNGQVLWSTYYGGNANDLGYGCSVDSAGTQVYMSGKTETNNGTSIATASAHQSANGGGAHDAFLAKFDGSGNRIWGTYYGGNGDDVGYGCAINVADYVYLTGYTGSGTGTVIATPASHQDTYGGNPLDGFVACFDKNGTRFWGSYYGGVNSDISNFCATDKQYNFYIGGVTETFTAPEIATLNSHQENYGMGFSDAFFAMFYDCTPPSPPANTTPSANLSICNGTSATLTISGIGSLKWFNSPTSSSSVGSGTVYVTPNLAPGTYSYYAATETCTLSSRAVIVLTVNPSPSVFVNTNKPLTCQGESATLSSAGLLSYNWSTGSTVTSIVVNPTVTTTYTVSGYDVYGCYGQATITQNVGGECVGLKEHLMDAEIRIFPNPSQGLLTVVAQPSSVIEIYSLTGQLVHHQKIHNKESEMDLKHLAPGKYLARIQINSKYVSIPLLLN